MDDCHDFSLVLISLIHIPHVLLWIILLVFAVGASLPYSTVGCGFILVRFSLMIRARTHPLFTRILH